jgi:hypothetical protein
MIEEIKEELEIMLNDNYIWFNADWRPDWDGPTLEELNK